MNIFTVLTVVFVVLKLLGIINWSWWLVTSPLWGGVIFGIVMAVIAGIFFGDKR